MERDTASADGIMGGNGTGAARGVSQRGASISDIHVLQCRKMPADAA